MNSITNKQCIIKNLTILANDWKQNQDNIRERAYRNAISALEGIPGDITSIKQVMNVPCIGKKNYK